MLTHFQISRAHDTVKTRHRRWGRCRKIFMTAEKQRVLYCDLFTDSCRFCVDSVNLKREGEGRLFDCDLFQHLSAPLLGAVR